MHYKLNKIYKQNKHVREYHQKNTKRQLMSVRLSVLPGVAFQIIATMMIVKNFECEKPSYSFTELNLV